MMPVQLWLVKNAIVSIYTKILSNMIDGIFETFLYFSEE